jgi:hypothetical protein
MNSYKSEHDQYDHHLNSPEMKESEKLKEQLHGEDNDIKAFAIDRKIKREIRRESFEEKYLPQLKQNTDLYVQSNPNGSYMIKSPFDIYDFFPKANKILERRNGIWHKNGIQFTIKHFNLKP